MDVGTTVTVEIEDIQDTYLIAEHQGERFSIAGEGSIGERRSIRVKETREDLSYAVTEGALIRLKIDKVIDESGVQATPAYGPVFIPASLTPGHWWRCLVTDVQDDCLIANPRSYIPRHRDIKSGSPPDDPTQSRNDLLSRRKP